MQDKLRQPVIFYRTNSNWEQEADAAKKYFPLVSSRMRVFGQDLVVGRYSTLPFYNELEKDLASMGAKMINSYRQHCYVADMKNWIEDIGVYYTPRTWYRLEDVPDGGGPFVVKGATNSKKDKWDTHCFAQTKRDAIEVYLRLRDDSFFSEQEIYVREYVPLKKYITGLRGIPVTDEYRFFVCEGEVFSGGFYWSNYVEDLPIKPNPNSVPTEFLNKILNKVRDKIPFFAMDVAQTESGNWILVELNDGTMSGLSENDPEVFYKNLKDILWTRHFKVVS